MPQSFLPYQNLSLGISVETLNQYWEMFQFSSLPNGCAMMGVASDCAVVYTLSTAQLLALNATPVQLIAPPITTVAGQGPLVPPAGFLFVPTTMTADYDFEGTAFTVGNADNAFQLEYTGKAVSLLSMTVTGLVDQAADTVATNFASATGTKFATANSANLGVEVKLVGTTPALTLGNGNVTLNVLYNTYVLF
jgi:hypothetical protein